MSQNCDSVLTAIENKLSDLGFQGALDQTILAIAIKGRVNGGANPPESFQVFVNGYIPFWNEVDEGCNTVSWEWWWTTTDHLLTTQLRKRMNDIVRELNYQLRRSAFRLKNEGVIYVDGFQDPYIDHQFCDPKADTDLKKPISPNTWFWAGDRFVPKAPKTNTSTPQLTHSIARGTVTKGRRQMTPIASRKRSSMP